MSDPFAALYKSLGHQFSNPSLLEEALTHPSISASKSVPSYQRLEFLGDRVLGLVVAEMLFLNFPDEEEGTLSRRLTFLVRRETLVKVALDIGLNDFVRITKAEMRSGGRQRESILADVCEAIIAALYFDGGHEKAKAFIHKYWLPILEQGNTDIKDPKSLLQEWAQQRGKPIPEYVLVKTTGADHRPTFVLEVRVQGLPTVKGTGLSKREAAQNAAQDMLQQIEVEDLI